MSTAPDITSSHGLPARLPKGFVLERYTVDGWLRDGGMAAIYRARRGPNQQRVALKLQLPSTAHDLAICERFDREAEVMCRANGSPHVAELYDSGVLEDGRRYFVLEWVDGENLEELLDFLRNQDQRMPLVRACKIARDIARGLAELHAHGVLHLDLKPANVMVAQADDGGDEIKLVDFGIAADLHEEDTSDGEHVVMGTSGYMSPEQVRGEPSSPTFDVYALGVLLFEALSGSSVPPDGWKPETLPPLESLRKGVPEPLAALVRACMDFDPARRPASAQVVATTLVKIIRTLQAEGKPSRRPSSGSIAVRTGGTEIVPQSSVPTLPAAAANREPPRTGATEVMLTHEEVMLSSGMGLGLAADVLDEGRRGFERKVEDGSRSPLQRRWAIVGGALLGLVLVIGVGVWLGGSDGQDVAPVVAARAGGVEAAIASPSERALERAETAALVDSPQHEVVKRDGAVVDEVDAVVDEVDAVVDEVDAVVDEVDAVVDDAGTVVVDEVDPVVDEVADGDEDGAPESEAAPEPSPATVARKREGPSAEACKSARAEAVQAKQSRSWRTVLKVTTASSCWTNSKERLERKQLRVQAHAELGEFGKCAKEGGKAKDEAIAARVKFCKKQLGGA